jgi:hypothetical protein
MPSSRMRRCVDIARTALWEELCGRHLQVERITKLGTRPTVSRSVCLGTRQISGALSESCEFPDMGRPL